MVFGTSDIIDIQRVLNVLNNPKGGGGCIF